MRDERLAAGAVEVDEIDHQFAVGAFEAVVDKDDLLAVGREMAVEIGIGALGQERLEVGAVNVHGAELHGAALPAREEELLAVGRPAEVLQEAADLAAD